MRTLLIFAVLIVGFFALYYFFAPTASAPADLPTDAAIREALHSATLDLSAFGGGAVTLTDGEAIFSTDATGSSPAGFVGSTEHVAILYKGSDADVYTIVNISGGGTGVFPHLVHFAFSGAGATLTEVQKVPLGDRIIVDSVHTAQTAPTSYDVLVSIRERLPHEAMAALPTEPRVLHFVRGSEGLALADVTFGTIENPEVVIISPLPGGAVGKSFVVSGAARGPWFFEANLPVELQTLSGKQVAVVGAHAQGEWMTTELVPFSAAFTVPATVSGPHLIVVRKDNPSGQKENDASFSFPVVVQ